MNLSQFERRLIARRIHGRLRRYFRQKWNIAVTPYPASVVAGLEGDFRQRQALVDLQWMAERRDAFAADPFIVPRPESSSDLLICYEHYPWREKRGRLHCVGFKNDAFEASRVVLDHAFHLSYPYIVPDKDALFMLPEQSESGNVSLYRLNDSGHVSGKEVLVDGLGLVDPSILCWQDKYWMFATSVAPNDTSDLHIYHADELTGPWAAHARNPVKRDRSNARAAGQFIQYGGEIFRPAQDCGPHYGSGIIINRIKRLTEDEFEESPVSEIRPIAGSRYNYGLHTISSAGQHTVIDGARIECSVHPVFDGLGRFFPPY